MRDHDVTRLIDAAAKDAAWLAPRLANTMRRVDEWAGLGYPAGGSNPTRGGDDTPIPERLAVAGEKRDRKGNHIGWSNTDLHGADRLEAEVTLRSVADGLAWLRRFDARNRWIGVPDPDHPLRKPPPTTATCRGCGRTIAANAIDPCLAGYCTSSKDRPLGGCHADWQDDKREKDRVRQANHRARQRGVEVAEFAEGVTFE